MLNLGSFTVSACRLPTAIMASNIEGRYIKRKSCETRMASSGIQFDFLAIQLQLRSTRYRVMLRYQRTFVDLYLPRNRGEEAGRRFPTNEVISRGQNVFVGWAQKQFGDNGHSVRPIRLFLMITASFRSSRRIELDPVGRL